VLALLLLGALQSLVAAWLPDLLQPAEPEAQHRK
jgi:hypothetical protein